MVVFAIGRALVHRLNERFKLLGLPSMLSLGNKVFLVSSVDTLLRTSKILTVIVAVSGVGAKLVYTVPVGKRIYLSNLTFDFLETGNKGDGAYAYRSTVDGIQRAYIFYVATLSAVALLAINLPCALQLEAGDRLYVNCSTFGGAEDLYCYLAYVEEDVS